MNIIDIFYNIYLTPTGENLSVGGVETYIYNLSQLANKHGIQTRVFQFAETEFYKEFGNSIVFGINSKNKNFDVLWRKATKTRDSTNAYLSIIANDTLIPRWKVPNSIVIQHGIGFDSTTDKNRPILLEFAYKSILAYQRIKRIYNVDEVVCVDNNYINWFHTQIMRRDLKLTPILNFTKIGPKVVSRDDSIIKIVFARRFVKIRGSHLFAPVARLLLDKYDNIEITFAGNGPEEGYLKNYLNGYSNVKFTEYNTVDSIDFHQNFHIAIVPTVYSEGTSLSLLEAMAAHCAVIATNIGGLSNIILDGYNGLMISPDEGELYTSLCSLVDDTKLRVELSNNAYDTVKGSFSLEKWEEAWSKVLKRRFKML